MYSHSLLIMHTICVNYHCPYTIHPYIQSDFQSSIWPFSVCVSALCLPNRSILNHAAEDILKTPRPLAASTGVWQVSVEHNEMVSINDFPHSDGYLLVWVRINERSPYSQQTSACHGWELNLSFLSCGLSFLPLSYPATPQNC